MDSETKQMFELILNKLGNIDTRLDKIDTQQDKTDSRLDRMESRQDEIYQVVKAIEHANQVHKAEIDNVQIRTATSTERLMKLAKS